MTRSEFASIYDGFSKDDQMYFLARLMHALTITVRGYYSIKPQVVRSEPDSRVGILNEVQHRIAGHLRDVIIETPERATGEAIYDTLFNWAEPAHLEQDMIWTLDTALSRLKSRTK